MTALLVFRLTTSKQKGKEKKGRKEKRKNKMRNQSLSSKNDLPFDLSQFDEDETLEPEKVNQIVNSSMVTSIIGALHSLMMDVIVWDPVVQIIEPTLATGKNTQVFISICHKMVANAELGASEALKQLDKVTTALNDTNEIIESLRKTSESKQSEINEIDVVMQLAEAEHLKLKALETIGLKMREFKEAIGTLIRLGDGLLFDQQQHGADIKTGAPFLRYTFTCSAIDGQWKIIQNLFADMAKLLLRTDQLALLQRSKKVELTGAETSKKPSSQATLEAVSNAAKEAAESDGEKAKKRAEE